MTERIESPLELGQGYHGPPARWYLSSLYHDVKARPSQPTGVLNLPRLTVRPAALREQTIWFNLFIGKSPDYPNEPSRFRPATGTSLPSLIDPRLAETPSGPNAGRARARRIFFSEPEPNTAYTASLETMVNETQGLLLEMLKDRFERAIDRLLECQLHAAANGTSERDTLFDLYHDGILTKGEVIRRGGIPEGDFHSEARAYRLRARDR